jgi:hypothetical protein
MAQHTFGMFTWGSVRKHAVCRVPEVASGHTWRWSFRPKHVACPKGRCMNKYIERVLCYSDFTVFTIFLNPYQHRLANPKIYGTFLWAKIVRTPIIWAFYFESTCLRDAAVFPHVYFWTGLCSGVCSACKCHLSKVEINFKSAPLAAGDNWWRHMWEENRTSSWWTSDNRSRLVFQLTGCWRLGKQEMMGRYAVHRLRLEEVCDSEGNTLRRVRTNILMYSIGDDKLVLGFLQAVNLQNRGLHAKVSSVVRAPLLCSDRHLGEASRTGLRQHGSSVTLLRYALFWDLTQRRMVILCISFGATYRSHLQG